MKYRDEKQRNGSRGAYGMNAGNETRIMAAWLLPAACDRSYRTSCNGHLALCPSEQIGWQEWRRSRSPVAWREQTVNKKQRLLSSFQIGKGISYRQLVAPALEDILRRQMKIYCEGEWRHSFFHEVCFNYYRLIVRFSPSCNVIEYCTTMESADFSRQALLRFFRKKNYLKRPWDLLG